MLPTDVVSQSRSAGRHASRTAATYRVTYLPTASAVTSVGNCQAYSEGCWSCLLMPRWRPDGTRNGLSIQRLEDKFGNRSNAKSNRCQST